MTKSVINVQGMSCKHCVHAVTEAISAISGVSNVDVSLKKNTATVKYDDSLVSIDSIKAAIKEAGYEAA